jgi:hypothetical protein
LQVAELQIADYCREVERYLCQKNDGHLIRIVGPSFERVSSWASQGVPFKIACRGIDRYFERYYAKGPRRRPVRIDFCEADVLDVFDEWRRAVGLPSAAVMDPTLEAGTESRGQHERRGPSLPSHLERVLLRLTAARANDALDQTFDGVLDRVSQELDLAKSEARGVRGAARQQMVDRLAALDRDMLDAARATLGEAELSRLSHDAEEELSAFRVGMSVDAFARARVAAVDRLVRERFALPTITFI